MTHKKYIVLTMLACFGITAKVEKKEFDFIIVGSGCSGTVALERLTEDPSVEVLCIDAGNYFRSYPGTQGNPDPSAVQHCRIRDFRLQDANNNSLTQNSEWSQGWVPLVTSKFGLANIPGQLMINNDTIWENILFGGGSTINIQNYWRGCPWMYDYFANELKLEGWSWNEVEPLHEKIEFTLLGSTPIDTTDWKCRGTQGPLLVDITPDTNREPFFAEALGLPFVKDYQIANYDANNQLIKQMFTTFQGNRTRVVSGYIDYFNQEDIRKTRPNVHIELGTPVWRVLFNEKKEHGNYRAIGVETTTGEKYYARKEVLICAGFAGSTQLLLLSGIGDTCDLERFGIKTYIHSPGVGKFIGDHFAMFFINEVFLPNTPSDFAVNNMILRVNPDTINDFPDIKIPVFVEPLFPQFRAVPIVMEWPLTGELSLVSANPLSKLNLSSSLYNPFTLDGEIKPELGPLFIGLYRSLVDLIYAINTPSDPTQPNQPQVLPPSPSLVDFPVVAWIADQNGILKSNEDPTLTDADIIDQYKRAFSIQNLPTKFSGPIEYQHPMGGCRMGNRKVDPEAVVDNKLIVYGTSNLRVASNAIMPRVPGRNQVAGLFGHPSAWIYFFGEKLSQLIKDKYGYSSISPKPCPQM